MQTQLHLRINVVSVSNPDRLIEGVIEQMSEFTEEKVVVSGNLEQEGNEEKVDEVKTTERENELPETEAADTAETEVAEPVEPVEPEEPDEAEEPVEAEVSAEQVMEKYSEMPTPVPNQIVSGKIVQIGTDEVLVDIGYKSEGRIPLNELGLKSGQQPSDIFSVGQEIDVWVLKVDDAEGNIVLSKRRADTQNTWEELEAKYAENEPINAEVSQVVKGGLLVELGVRGFIPASHVSRGFVDNLEEYVGQSLDLKIIELDRQKNNVVLSHKELLEEEYQKVKEEIFNSLEQDTIVDGVVRRITNFGAFVDVGGGVEGLLHVSEMAYSRVKHPSDVVSEGEEIRVMVLGVDKENERISLGLKQTLPDPWDTIDERYHVGDKVSGEVTRTVDFGAFVKLEDGVEGLIHISQLSHRHVAKTEDVVQSGDEVEVKVISLDPQARRIGLSIRELEPKPEPKPVAKKPTVELVKDSGEEELTTTLGDMFGDLFKDK